MILCSSIAIVRQPQARELPARRGREEITVACTLMTFRRRERTSAQHHLIDHELAVVFAQRACDRLVAGIRRVWTLRPLPDTAEGIGERTGARGHFPFGFAWQA